MQTGGEEKSVSCVWCEGYLHTFSGNACCRERYKKSVMLWTAQKEAIRIAGIRGSRNRLSEVIAYEHKHGDEAGSLLKSELGKRWKNGATV
jgi:hypothetical protein